MFILTDRSAVTVLLKYRYALLNLAGRCGLRAFNRKVRARV